MTWKESLEWQKKEKAFLDTLDLQPFFVSGASIYDIMEEIEDKYGNLYTEEVFIFNCMDSIDFIDYIRQRYENINIYEYLDWRVR